MSNIKPKVICVTSDKERLTKDKVYEVIDTYTKGMFEQYYIYNDLKHYKYYPITYFRRL